MDDVLDQLASGVSQQDRRLNCRSPMGPLFISVSAPILHFSRHPNVEAKREWGASAPSGRTAAQNDQVPAFREANRYARGKKHVRRSGAHDD
ncbi:hypothetical protein [Bradyrhizobium ottawaense]|uniref:hypothetical protein n=1 Tax=Bradyrhizobium ottawaense TaxID=931866 RepID=UPI003F9EE21B